MNQAILYSFRRCPYAMRARMALYVSSIDYEHREVLLRDKPTEMLELSPKGTVPVFVTPNGQVIDESLAIMDYALFSYDPHSWLRDSSTFTSNLITLMDETFKFHLDRYKYASRYDPNAKRGDVNLYHREEAVKILSEWEEALSKSFYLLDDHVSLADVATFPFIRQFAATEPHWWAEKPLPNTWVWLQSLTDSDLFKMIMKKHPHWKNEV